MDKVSILKSSRFCTKHIKKRPNGELTASQVSVGSLFDHRYHSVKSLKELSELLKFFQNDAHSFVVRGELIDEANNSQIRRCVRPRDGEEPTFKAAARRWCCIDIDEIDLPEHLADFKINREAIVAYTSSQLPEQFHNVQCWYQFSSNMGIKQGKVRLHLWYWLSRPCSDQEPSQRLPYSF